MLLLLVTLAVLLSSCVSFFVTLICNKLNGRSHEEVALINELKDLREAAASISAVDEFAKYARAQRGITKANDKLNALASERSGSQLKRRVVLNIGFKALLVSFPFNEDEVLNLWSPFGENFPGAPCGCHRKIKGYDNRQSNGMEDVGPRRGELLLHSRQNTDIIFPEIVVLAPQLPPNVPEL
ncbi:unnamed protein product [Notodromas monacha]|uniref:Guided entry of tail-anchored proteins factor 1 n=1 Tax=Notodromas monacha TaxID=399045 RepID=A0A7R9BKH8_9CRUS|nr:unnamed protein product [Notodromas monacha]CAG0915836.1 unnamed protein product [Notodromas monacha]